MKRYMTVIFPNFVNSKVLVVGDVMLDRYWYGLTNKIAPEAPVPIVKVDRIVDQLGGAANVARHVVSVGARSGLLGLTGIDESAKILKKQLINLRVTCHLISVPILPTIVKLRIVSRNQQLIRLDFEENFSNDDANELLKKVKLVLPKYNILVLSDYNKGSLNRIEEIIQLAIDMDMPVIIDPKGTNFSRYTGATILTPNISEFEAIVGVCANEQVLVNRAKELISEYNLSALLITRSEQGMILLQRNSQSPCYFPAKAKEVYDVTGAGDIVVGVLSAAISSGKSLESACFLANSVVGSIIGVRSRQCTDSKLTKYTKNIIFFRKHINDISISLEKILEEQDLKKVIFLARKQGDKIVMTNGVFDVLHPGHISYLTRAKQLGEKLIVAVNSDDSTARLKGKTRPINTLQDRMLMLSVLSMVDWVIPFYEDTPTRLINSLSPDILVKGGDYPLCDIQGSQSVIRTGGKVYSLNFKSGYSSSRIIRLLKNNDV